MNEMLMNMTKLAAYFLWEYTEYDNPLNHWYCAEDIACYLEESSILTTEDINAVLRRGKYDYSYIEFIRHIAFRIYIYTNQEDTQLNWFAAEKLANNFEWCEAITKIAEIYSKEKTNSGFITRLRSDKVRSFYNTRNLM